MEALRINNRGNVGIGTTTPATTLHVQTTAVPGVSHAYYGSLIVENSGESAIDIVGTSYSSIYFADAASPYAGGIVYNHSLNALDFRVNTNTNAMWIDSGGDVGIGTTSPANKLHIIANTAGIEYDTGAGVRVDNAASSPDVSIMMAVSSANNIGIIQTLEPTVSWSTKNLAIQPRGGNVGIGTSTPTEKLEVKGNIVLNGQSTATGTTELDSLIFRKSHPSGVSSGYYNQGLIKGVTYGGYAGGMNFYYNRSNNDGSGSYTNTQALWLNQYGNFCIGENSSSYKLRVKGGTIANNSVSNGVYVTAGTSSSNHALYVEGESSGGEWLAVRGDGEIRLNASNGHTYAAQGIRFGANATANNLDDYEEGTWTPVAYASSGTATGSYSEQLGTYTKTGRQVICMFDITLILSGTMVGFAGISGLPFTVGTSSATGGGMAGYSVNQFRSSSLFAVAGAGRQISGFPQQNASYIYCQVDNSGVNGFGSAGQATWNIGTTGRCTGYVIYFTN